MAKVKRGEVEKLAAFKAYVHKRFDDAGVPANPEPPKHALEGCRVGDRFDFVTSELTTLREQLAEASRVDSRLCAIANAAMRVEYCIQDRRLRAQAVLQSALSKLVCEYFNVPLPACGAGADAELGRLKAMICQVCGGDGFDKRPRLGDGPCVACGGFGLSAARAAGGA